jgi:hypothetical protein
MKTRLAVTTLLLLMVSQIFYKFISKINYLLTLARDLISEEENYEKRFAELKTT